MDLKENSALPVGTFSPQALHLTTNTCREFEPWNREAAEASMRRRLFTIALTQIEFLWAI